LRQFLAELSADTTTWRLFEACIDENTALFFSKREKEKKQINKDHVIRIAVHNSGTYNAA
jgi:hypothetical protein